MIKKFVRGISFIEILITVAIFAVLGILIGRIVLVTLRGSNKSEAMIKVRENLDYAVAVMERQIRNAEMVSPCPNASVSRIDYRDAIGMASYFSCTIAGNDSYLASGSSRLTSNEVYITSCNFICSPAQDNKQTSVTIDLEARDSRSLSIETARTSASTQIFLRTY